tara:strand:- start:61 stop:297 length:237 start_codon:yes stop_codon:yes gene_type:complete
MGIAVAPIKVAKYLTGLCFVRIEYVRGKTIASEILIKKKGDNNSNQFSVVKLSAIRRSPITETIARAKAIVNFFIWAT